jgi:hypothetical protein
VRPRWFLDTPISREQRIRSHVLLCWLALLLIWIAETATGDTWRNLRLRTH